MGKVLFMAAAGAENGGLFYIFTLHLLRWDEGLSFVSYG